MKTKLSKLTMTMLMLALSGMVAFAQSGDSNPAPAEPPSGSSSGPAHGWRGHGRGPMGPMMAAMLGLTEDQQSQIQSIHSAAWTAMRPLMQQEEALRQQLLQATETATFNQAKVQALATQLAQIQAQMTVARAQSEWKIFNVLTPDQQSKLAQFQQQMEQKRQSRMNRQSPTS